MTPIDTLKRYFKTLILDSERSSAGIDFTTMCVRFIFTAVCKYFYT